MVGLAILISVVVALAILIAMAVTAVCGRQIPGVGRQRSPGVGGDWGGQGLRGEDALVPVGPPRKPKPAAAVALPPPEPESDPVDAYGREVLGGEVEGDALAS
jgi:hypothetical protein